MKQARGLGVVVACLALLMAACGSPGSTDQTVSLDGTYDWYLGPINGEIRSCSACVFVTNGKVQNSEGSFYNGGVSANAAGFNGPCPNGNAAIGIYEGLAGGLALPEWQGTWRCDDGSDGGPNSVWKIFNQH